jgi:hypothetical protein
MDYREEIDKADSPKTLATLVRAQACILAATAIRDHVSDKKVVSRLLGYDSLAERIEQAGTIKEARWMLLIYERLADQLWAAWGY